MPSPGLRLLQFVRGVGECLGVGTPPAVWPLTSLVACLLKCTFLPASTTLPAGEKEEDAPLLSAANFSVARSGAPIALGPDNVLQMVGAGGGWHCCCTCAPVHKMASRAPRALLQSTAAATLFVHAQVLTPTPRWPDLMVAYLPSERILFSSKLFSAHVAADAQVTSRRE